MLRSCSFVVVSAFAIKTEPVLLLQHKYGLEDRTNEMPSSRDAKVHCVKDDLDWARFIDGMFSDDGPNSFGESYTEHMLAAWDWIQRPDFRLDLAHLVQLHSMACATEHVAGIVRGQTEDGSNGAGEHYNSIGLAVGKCIVSLPNLEQILEDVPDYVVNIRRDADGRIDNVNPATFSSQMEVKEALNKLIERYSVDLLTTNSSIRTLGTFLRSLAWLHAFIDCNGRTRTLLLQAELQRLGYEMGAFMFNNNRNHYFLTAAEFETQIEEGINMADDGLNACANPWDETTRDRHKTNFPVDPALKEEDCINDFKLDNLALASA